MSHRPAVAIPLSKKKLALMLPLGVAFVATSVVLYLTAEDQSRFNPVYVRWVSALCAVVFTVVLPLVVRKLLDDRSGLLVTREGIVDNSSAISAGAVAWEEVEGFTPRPPNTVTVHVSDPTPYLRRGGSFHRFIARTNHRSYGSPVHIAATTLKIPFDDLMALLTEYYEAHASEPEAAR